MPGSVSNVNNSTAADSGNIDLGPLQDSETKALQNMAALTAEQTKFNAEMNTAKAAHSAAQASTING